MLPRDLRQAALSQDQPMATPPRRPTNPMEAAEAAFKPIKKPAPPIREASAAPNVRSLFRSGSTGPCSTISRKMARLAGQDQRCAQAIGRRQAAGLSPPSWRSGNRHLALTPPKPCRMVRARTRALPGDPVERLFPAADGFAAFPQHRPDPGPDRPAGGALVRHRLHRRHPVCLVVRQAACHQHQAVA